MAGAPCRHTLRIDARLPGVPRKWGGADARIHPGPAPPHLWVCYGLVSELSEEKTRPMVALPSVSVFLVMGPPASEPMDRNWPKTILYVDSRPCWQKGRCGHSAGPARIVALPEHFAAKSDSVLRPYLSAVPLVTANAL